MKIQDLDQDLQLVADSGDILEIDSQLGIEDKETHGYFVRVLDGDYVTIYRYNGFIPFLDKEVEQLRP